MSAKLSPAIKQTFAQDTSTPGSMVPPPPEWLLVCLQDPFDGVGDSSSITRINVPAADGSLTNPWMLEAALEINPPRFFASWATRGTFLLDLSVSATTLGTWGGTVTTGSGSGNCRVMVMRDDKNKPQFTLESNARHAPEMTMPPPAQHRFLNADIAFELNGKCGLSASAVAVISNMPWSRLIAGSSVASQGLAFDGKWRHNLAIGDGEALVPGRWAFAVMSPQTYQNLCAANGWEPHVE